MDFFCKYPSEVNKTNYLELNDNTEVFYGLPKNVKFCKSCVISNQRPSTSVEFKNDGKQPKKAINFNDDGICDACKVRKNIENIDWEAREKELKQTYLHEQLVEMQSRRELISSLL